MDVGKTCLIGIQKDRQPLNAALKLIQLPIPSSKRDGMVLRFVLFVAALDVATHVQRQQATAHLFGIVKAVLLHKPVLFHHSSAFWGKSM